MNRLRSRRFLPGPRVSLFLGGPIVVGCFFIGFASSTMAPVRPNDSSPGLLPTAVAQILQCVEGTRPPEQSTVLASLPTVAAPRQLSQNLEPEEARRTPSPISTMPKSDLDPPTPAGSELASPIMSLKPNSAANEQILTSLEKRTSAAQNAALAAQHSRFKRRLALRRTKKQDTTLLGWLFY